jgi:hypothetical protein
MPFPLFKYRIVYIEYRTSTEEVGGKVLKLFLTPVPPFFNGFTRDAEGTESAMFLP